MSVAVVQGPGAAAAEPTAGAVASAARTQPGRLPADESSGSAVQGSVPKREGQALKSASLQAESHPYEVQMQHDPQLENELIFRYVNREGDLILQVPSAEALSVKRGILEEFHRRSSHVAEATPHT